MSDEKKPGGTLTLKPRPAPKEDEASTRQRSGSRARRVEQMARQQGVEAPKPPDSADTTPAGEARPARSRSESPDRPARSRPAGQQPSQSRPPRNDSPRSDSPRRNTPRGDSSRGDSPREDSARSTWSRNDSARSNSPRGDFTRSDSHRSDSPRNASPRGDAPRARPPGEFRAERPEDRRSDKPRFQRARPDEGRPERARGDAPRRPDTGRAAPERRARPVTREIVGDDTVFQVFVPCPQGLEAALADELQALGFAAKVGRAGCHLSADWPGVRRINLFSRLAARVLVKLSSSAVQTEDDILELARATRWERWFGPEHSLRVDTSAVRSPMKSLQYCNLRAKDGICDRLREREGARPDIDTVRPDARVHLFLDEHTATLYLDTSGESLFKRGWRLDKGEAPIRENLAAGMLALSGWQPGEALLDPFCGSGTILIEAAWKAMGMPPGIMRPFAFERLRHHDRQEWYAYKDEMRSQARRTALTAPLVGVDLDPASIAAARANASRAGLGSGEIRFQEGDACEVLPPAQTGHIVTNPPYGERLANDDPELWSRWASHLKHHYSGWQVHAISSDLQLPQHMRLQARRRHPLHNGALDCRLFSFDMVSDRYEG